MNTSTIVLKLNISANGIPCLWENGGKKDENLGKAFLIGDKNGRAKRAIFVHKNPKPNAGQALIPVRVDDYIVNTKLKGEDLITNIYKIIQIEGESATLELINSYTDKKWANPLDRKFNEIVFAAKRKAQMIDCVEASYINTRPKRPVQNNGNN